MRRTQGAQGGIGSLLAKAGSFALRKVAPKLLGGPVGIGAAVLGAAGGARAASKVGTAVAKRAKVTLPGGTTVRPLALLPGGVPLVQKKKYRRMNPMNIKALRRAVRRVDAAEKQFKKVLMVQGKKATGVKPRPPRRRS